MKISIIIIVFILPLVILAGVLTYFYYQQSNIKDENMSNNATIIQLPQPLYQGQLSIEEAINRRKSIRDYSNQPLTLIEVSQLLWAAQGKNQEGSKVAPSAGALYSIEIYVVAKNVEGLVAGIYHYLSEDHALEVHQNTQIDQDLKKAAYDQSYVEEAPVKIIISGIFARTTKKYGERGIQYVYQESGHIAQNIYLQAESLGLGTVVVGGFDQKKVDNLFNFKEGQQTLYIMPVGKK